MQVATFFSEKVPVLSSSTVTSQVPTSTESAKQITAIATATTTIMSDDNTLIATAVGKQNSGGYSGHSSASCNKKSNNNDTNDKGNNNLKLNEGKRKRVCGDDVRMTRQRQQRMPNFNIVVKKLKSDIVKRFNNRKILRSTVMKQEDPPNQTDEDIESEDSEERPYKNVYEEGSKGPLSSEEDALKCVQNSNKVEEEVEDRRIIEKKNVENDDDFDIKKKFMKKNMVDNAENMLVADSSHEHTKLISNSVDEQLLPQYNRNNEINNEIDKGIEAKVKGGTEMEKETHIWPVTKAPEYPHAAQSLLIQKSANEIPLLEELHSNNCSNTNMTMQSHLPHNTSPNSYSDGHIEKSENLTDTQHHLTAEEIRTSPVGVELRKEYLANNEITLNTEIANNNSNTDTYRNSNRTDICEIGCILKTNRTDSVTATNSDGSSIFDNSVRMSTEGAGKLTEALYSADGAITTAIDNKHCTEFDSINSNANDFNEGCATKLNTNQIPNNTTTKSSEISTCMGSEFGENRHQVEQQPAEPERGGGIFVCNSYNGVIGYNGSAAEVLLQKTMVAENPWIPDDLKYSTTKAANEYSRSNDNHKTHTTDEKTFCFKSHSPKQELQYMNSQHSQNELKNEQLCATSEHNTYHQQQHHQHEEQLRTPKRDDMYAHMELQQQDQYQNKYQQQIQAYEHILHAQQQHYPQETLFQLQHSQHHQQQHQQQSHPSEMLQHASLRNQMTTKMHDQQLHRQAEHTHLMSYLHPLQQEQIHKVYHDLMIEEFQEDPNTAYKLGLSPSNVKHENQDDGYETSAGDVLTPNSHSSSTHSVTPQHQIQHTIGLLPPTTKCEEQQQQQTQQQQQNQLQNQQQQQQEQQEIQLQQRSLAKANQELPGPTDGHTNLPNDPYGFMDDELGATGSMRMLSSQRESRGNCMTNYMSIPNIATVDHSDEMYTLQQQQQQLHGACSSSNAQQRQDINHKNKLINFTPGATVDKQQSFEDNGITIIAKPPQKRRGRKKKAVAVDGIPVGAIPIVDPNDKNAVEGAVVTGLLKCKERKKHDRFNGMTEEEVVKRTLPDHLCDNLDIVIIGINPGLFAAYKGHHYAGPGNHFWKCLYLSGLTQEQMSADEDYKLLKYGIGFTNMVERATKGSADLTRKEIKEGSRILLEKLQRYRPKIAVFNGKLIFEVFSGKKDFNFGRQPEFVDGTDTYVWVMPSSSARCAQLPRAADKVPFYAALKKFRDYLNGVIPHIDESECIFTEHKIKQCCEQENMKCIGNSVEQQDMLYNNAPNQDNSSSLNRNYTTHNSDATTNQNNSLMQHEKLRQLSSSHGGYLFGSDENLRGTTTVGHTSGPGPPGPTLIGIGSISQHNGDNYMLPPYHGQQQPEKKKRGRPKKIKGEEMIDPTTGNKIQVTNMQIGTDFHNILNLSIMDGGNGGAPKKKRGRPKKVKPLSDISQAQTPIMPQKPNAMSIQALTSEHRVSPHVQNTQQSQTLYIPPQLNVQHSLYARGSPMHSPALNCSYATITPPTGEQCTPPMHHQCEKLGDSKSMDSPTSLEPHRESVVASLAGDTHLGESPPPSSPNICAVDFEPPNATNNINSENHESDAQQRQIMVHQRMQQNPRYASPALESSTANEHFQQWLSPQHQQHMPPGPPTHFSQQTQQTQYQDQNLQLQNNQQQQQSQATFHSQWQRHQRYDGVNDHYLIASAEHQHLHQQPLPQPAQQVSTSEHQPKLSQNTSLSSDVASKSLSGLESLVEQIPTIADSESGSTGNIAAAATVESRLQGLQNPNSQRNNMGSTTADLQSDHFSGASAAGSTPNGNLDINDAVTRNSSGSNTPQTGNSIYGANSPGNYSVHRINSTASSPVLMSPHHAQQQLQQQHTHSQQYTMLPSATHTSTAAMHTNSPSDGITEQVAPCTPPIAAATVGSTNIYTSTASNIHNSNFSVSNLAASSATSSNNKNYAPAPGPSTSSTYHHSNFIAAAALAAAAANTPANSQMYMDPHSHMPHVVNSIYPPTHHAVHHHAVHHHQPPHHHPAYGPTSQHNAAAEYGGLYGSTNATTTGQTGTAHMLHMPSPNYPYGYATPSTQTNYAGYHPHSHPHPHHPHHSHPHAHAHATHHLSMFERLKPSDIGGYGGF